MAFVPRISLNIGGIRETLTLKYAKRIGHAFCKKVLAIVILLSTRGTADSDNLAYALG